jgi:hypothetical protein
LCLSTAILKSIISDTFNIDTKPLEIEVPIKEEKESKVLNAIEKVAGFASMVPFPVVKGVGIAATLGIQAYKHLSSDNKSDSITNKNKSFNTLASAAFDVAVAKIPGGGMLLKGGTMVANTVLKKTTEYNLESKNETELAEAGLSEKPKSFSVASISSALSQMNKFRNKSTNNENDNDSDLLAENKKRPGVRMPGMA